VGAARGEAVATSEAGGRVEDGSETREGDTVESTEECAAVLMEITQKLIWDPVFIPVIKAISK
jgi:hypothetical protein